MRGLKPREKMYEVTCAAIPGFGRSSVADEQEGVSRAPEIGFTCPRGSTRRGTLAVRPDDPRHVRGRPVSDPDDIARVLHGARAPPVPPADVKV